MSYLAGSLRKRLRILGLLAVPLGASPALANYATPIGLTGWNADVIHPINEHISSALAGTFGNPYAWFPSTQTGDGGIIVDQANGFYSAVADPYTKDAGGNLTHSYFQFRPLDQDNALYMQSQSNGTFTLTAPAPYNNLAILAASAGPGWQMTAGLTLNFADGTVVSGLSYNAFDWGGGGQGQGSPMAFAQDVERSKEADNNGSLAEFVSDTSDGPSFNVYETDINLAALGCNNTALESITFDRPCGYIGIFAVSGVENTDPSPAPEPATLALFALGGLVLLASRRRRKR